MYMYLYYIYACAFDTGTLVMCYLSLIGNNSCFFGGSTGETWISGTTQIYEISYLIQLFA